MNVDIGKQRVDIISLISTLNGARSEWCAKEEVWAHFNS